MLSTLPSLPRLRHLLKLIYRSVVKARRALGRASAIAIPGRHQLNSLAALMQAVVAIPASCCFGKTYVAFQCQIRFQKKKLQREKSLRLWMTNAG